MKLLSNTFSVLDLTFLKSSLLLKLTVNTLVGRRGSVVERQSLASVLSPSCARPVADG